MKKPQSILILFLGILGLYSFYLIGKSVGNTPHTNSNAAQMDKFRKDGVPLFMLPLFDIDQGKPTGVVYSLKESRASLKLINFWASWCEPCIAEYPSLVDLSGKFKDDPMVEVITVSIDEDPMALKKFVDGRKRPESKNFRYVWDRTGKVAELYGTKKIPETYVVDGNRKLLMKVIDRQDWVAPDFTAFIRGHLERSKYAQ